MRFDEVIRGVFDAVDSAAEEQNERNRRSDEELPVFPDVVYRRRSNSKTSSKVPKEAGEE